MRMKLWNKKTGLITIVFIVLIVAFMAVKKKPEKKSGFVLEEATIQSVQTAITQHTITCEQLVNLYIDRIKKYNLSVNEKAPINAIARINVNVIDQARALDKIFAKGNMKGPLHCIPVLLKDNIDSYDSPSTSGSLSLLGNQPIEDAVLTKKLRDAGAVIFGKGTMDEFAAGVVGISGGNGRTGNVYDTSKNPGGSSGGSAVAVSANFVMIGIGTDNSGSIRIPAAFNGIVGLRPSTGLVSQTGIFPRGNLDGIAGPLTRNVEDLARVLDVIATPEHADKKTYSAYLDKNSLHNKRIGIVTLLETLEIFKEMPPENQIAFQNALIHLHALGATIVPNIKLPHYNLESKYNQAGEREEVNHYLASFPAAKKDYYAICESNRTRAFGNNMECFEFIRNYPKKYGAGYRKALAMFEKNKHYVEKIMDHDHLDALLIPVTTQASATYLTPSMITEAFASNAGLPAITLNIGTNHDHLPVGVELIGKQFSEGTLIGMAYAYEKNAPARQPPIMPKPTLQFETWDIPQYNNLLTVIGYDTYKQFLEKSYPGNFEKTLTPEKFKVIIKKDLRFFRTDY